MKDIVFDQYINFEREKGYIPNCFITPEDEIRDICDKERILVQSIVKFDGYKVYCSKRIRNKKTYQEAKKLLEAKKEEKVIDTK